MCRILNIMMIIYAMLACFCLAADADSIRAGDMVLHDVLVSEAPRLYYVRVLADGRILSFTRDEVKPEDVIFEKNTGRRDELERAWRYREATETGKAPAADTDKPKEQANPPSTPITRKIEQAPGATEALVGIEGPGMRLRGVPLGVSLRAILRARGLDYKLMDGYVFISTPDRLRREPFEDIEVRTYTLKNPPPAPLTGLLCRNIAGSEGEGGAAMGSLAELPTPVQVEP